MRIGIRQDDGDGGGGVVAIDDPQLQLATVAGGNPLGRGDAEFEPLGRAAAGGRLILWSGSLGDELFASSPLTWMRPGREALDRFCAAAGPRLAQSGTTLCFHPHSRHVLSDPPSCFRFLEEHEGEPLAVALAPGSMIEPSMLDDIDDHLVRSFELLGPRCGLLILHDIKANLDGDACHPVPLGEGVLPRALIRSLIERHVPADVDLVLPPGPLEPQLEWLGRL